MNRSLFEYNCDKKKNHMRRVWFLHDITYVSNTRTYLKITYIFWKFHCANKIVPSSRTKSIYLYWHLLAVQIPVRLPLPFDFFLNTPPVQYTHITFVWLHSCHPARIRALADFKLQIEPGSSQRPARGLPHAATAIREPFVCQRF